MKKLFRTHPELCTGCRICEMACSFARSGEFGPFKSAIWIWKDEEKGIDLPVFCRHCLRPPCQKVCPVGAPQDGPIRRDSQSGAVILSTSNGCIGCLECLRTCPFAAIRMDPQKEELVKCDLCGGQPQCVEWCPTGAIRFVAANIPDLPQAYQKTNSEQQP